MENKDKIFKISDEQLEQVTGGMLTREASKWWAEHASEIIDRATEIGCLAPLMSEVNAMMNDYDLPSYMNPLHTLDELKYLVGGYIDIRDLI